MTERARVIRAVRNVYLEEVKTAYSAAKKIMLNMTLLVSALASQIAGATKPVAVVAGTMPLDPLRR